MHCLKAESDEDFVTHLRKREKSWGKVTSLKPEANYTRVELGSRNRSISTVLYERNEQVAG